MKVFIAAPFTGLVDLESGIVDDQVEAFLREVIAALRSDGHRIFSAHERENFGRKLDPPATALSLDIDGLARCDALVAFVGDPPSPGVQFEIGFALAKGKPILALTQADSSVPYLLRDFDTIENCRRRSFVSVADVLPTIAEFLDAARAAPTPDAHDASSAGRERGPDPFL